MPAPGGIAPAETEEGRDDEDVAEDQGAKGFRRRGWRKPPRGRAIRQALTKVIRRQRLEAERRLGLRTKDINVSAGPIDLSEFDREDFDDVRAGLEVYYRQGGERALARTGAVSFWDVNLPEAKTAIDHATIKLCKTTAETTSKELNRALDKLRSDLASEIIAGENTRQALTEVVGKVFENAETWRAHRIAVTEASRAVHDGQILAASQGGLTAGFDIILSPTACDICETAYAETGSYIDLERAKGSVGQYERDLPPYHPHCLVGETPVLSPDQRAAFVATYDGPVVELTLADGRRLTVTPNHMLLTPDGFACADTFRKGDYVLDCPDFERINAGHPNHYKGPTPIADVVGALTKSSGSSTRSVPVAPEYLHGDGAAMQGNIDIVGTDRFFESVGQAPLYELVAEPDLRVLHDDGVLLSGSGDLASVLFALAMATDRGMGISRERAAFGRRAALSAEVLRLGGSADAQTQVLEPPADSGPACAERLSYCQDRFSSVIATAQIVEVNVYPFSGHVYDLQSASTLYLANGVVSSNCMCTFIERMKTIEEIEG